MNEEIKDLEKPYISLGLDPETVEGDYRESFQKWTQFFGNPGNIDKRFFMSDNPTLKDIK